MAIKANEELKNKHSAFLGTSGSGKTWIVKKKLKDNPNANVLIFDPIEVYKDCVLYVDSFKDLVKVVTSAVKKNKQFRFAFRGRPDDYHKFCELCWLASDGSKTLFVVNEEAGGYLGNSAKESERWYDLITIGRKFGVIFLTVAQRPQNINKVVYDESPYCWIGHCKGKAREYVEREFKVDISQIGFETYSYFLSDNAGVTLMDKNGKPIE